MTDVVLARPQGPQASTVASTGRLRLALPYLVLAVPFALGAWRLAAHLGTSFWTAGDLAGLELNVRSALRADQLLGAYSRFGWDQLGPAWFYLVAPVYRLAGSDPRALFLATWLLNAAAAGGVVAVARRRSGSAAAWSAAAGLLAWLWWVTPRVVISPWNPLTLALPLLLTLVLAAAAFAGSGWSLVGAVACGSVVVQIHLASAPVVAAAVGLATVGWLLEHRPWTAGRRLVTRRRVTMAAVVLAGLATLWALSLIEQATTRPGNLVLTARFFRDGPPPGVPHHHPLGSAAATFSRQASAIPLGSDDNGLPGPSTPAREAVSLLWLAAAGACAALGWRARDRFASACGLFAGTAGVVGVLAATRVADGLVPYLFFYATVLPVLVIIGLGALAGPLRAARSVAALACGGLLVATGWSALRAPVEPEPSSGEVAVAAGLAGDALASAGHQRVMVRETRHDFWPVAVGVVAALERQGYRVTVEPNLVSLVGEPWAPTGSEQAEVIVGGSTDPVPGPTASQFGTEQRLGDAGPVGVWFRSAAGR